MPGLVSDDENDQAATQRCFRGAALHRRQAAGARAADGRRCDERAAGIAGAAGPSGSQVSLPAGGDRVRICRSRSATSAIEAAPDRDFGPHVIRQQRSQLRRSLRGLQREGFRHVFVIEAPRRSKRRSIERVPLWNDRTHEHGPFDIIGDVHGCCDELEHCSTDSAIGEIAIADSEPRLGEIGVLASRGPQGGLRRRLGGPRAADSRCR